jgi:uncharacterized coiled-coil protein SlyX
MTHIQTPGLLPVAMTAVDKLSERPARRRGNGRTWMVACCTLAVWLVGVGFGNCDVRTPAPGTQREAPVADRLAALEARLAQQDADIRVLKQGLAKAKATVSAMQGRMASVAAVSDLSPFVQVVPGVLNGLKGPHVIFSGCNVHIRDGSGFTNDVSADPTATGGPLKGLGNLVIGYNELRSVDAQTSGRSGSHNLIVGPGHQYSSFGGFVAGFENTISGPGASVSGGQNNTASGAFSSVTGGQANEASGLSASVSGGGSNEASGKLSSVSGGGAPGPDGGNTASGDFSSISGGQGNTASGPSSSISGGKGNTALGNTSSVSGGQANSAGGSFSSVSGGSANRARGQFSSVSGGEGSTAAGDASSVSGGDANQAIGLGASVSGGKGNRATGRDSSVVGGNGNTAGGSAASVSGGLSVSAGADNSTGSPLEQFIHVQTGAINGLPGPHVIIEGANLHIRSGSGFTSNTAPNGDPVFTGLGNLVVGYNELPSGLTAVPAGGRSGSHNLIIGPGHQYSSFGGFVAGLGNTISGTNASVSGGQNNTASGAFSSISGGGAPANVGLGGNIASGPGSSISGGVGNTASGPIASVSGGQGNTANGIEASVSGGLGNKASGANSSVSGGVGNEASGKGSSVSGGQSNLASGANSSVSGGASNTASGSAASVSGSIGISSSGTGEHH